MAVKPKFEAGDIVLADISGQLEFAELSLAAEGTHAAIETVSGRLLGGRLERVENVRGVRLHCPGGPIWLHASGNWVPGYASAKEHFDERRAAELEERVENAELQDWLKQGKL